MATNAADEVVRLQVQMTGASEAAASIAGMEREIAGAADGVRELEAQLKIMQSQKAVDIEQFRVVSGALDEQRSKLAEAQAAYAAMGGSATQAAAAARGGLGAIEAAAEKAAAAAQRAADKQAAAAQRAAAQEAQAAEKAAAAVAAAAEKEAAAAQRAAEQRAAAAEKAAAAAERAAEKEANAVEKAAAREKAAAEKAASAKQREAERAADAAERAADRQATANTRGLNSLKQFATAAGGPLGAIVGTAIEANEHFGNLTPRLKAAAVAIGAIGVAMGIVAVVTRGAAAAFRLFGSLLEVVIESADKTGTLAATVAEIKANAKGLFADTHIGDFVKALRDAFSFLSATTETGRALRQVLSGAMTEFFQAAARALPYVKQMVLGAAIVALQLYIAFRRVAREISDAVGPAMDMETALAIGKGAALALASAIAVIGAVALAVLYPIYQGIKLVGALWSALSNVGKNITATLSAIDLSTIASGMIDGLIEGITGSIGKVVSAATDLASAAVSTMKSVLDSHSPSEVFREIGDVGIGGGLVAGMGDAEGDVETGVSDLVDPAAVKTETKAARSGAGGRPIVYIENLVVQGVDDFRARLAEEFEIAAASAQGA